LKDLTLSDLFTEQYLIIFKINLT